VSLHSRQSATSNEQHRLGDGTGFVVVAPAFNDWESAVALLTDLDRVAADMPDSMSVVLVDDGSIAPCTFPQDLSDRLAQLNRVEVVHLAANFGHARAIAIGLSFVAARRDTEAVVVMDCDGEDRPSDIPRLIAAYREGAEKIVVAHRGRRSEGLLFTAFYRAYKGVFRLMTGRSISFGNFCLIPVAALRRLVFIPELWNHLAGSLVRSRFEIRKVSTHRGVRYYGESKMNFNSLILHGLGSISVDLDRVLVRILMAVLGFAGLLAIAMAAVVAYRFGTDLATPGWATTIVSALLIILMQSGVFAVLLLFLDLKVGAGVATAPALVYDDYVESIDVLRE